MKTEELKVALKDAEIAYEQAKKAIYIKHAKANNPYKIGDVISDHNGKLKIEQIKVFISYGESECVYEGISLNQNGTPAKKQGRNIYQCNIL